MIAFVLFIVVGCIDNKNRYLCNKEYPDYYGGYYYDEDGRLAVLIVTDFNVKKECVDSLLGVEDYYVIDCRYSYNDILCVHKYLNDFFMDRQNDFIIKKITINSLGISLKNNTVFVSLKDSIKENISLFRNKVSNSPIISFEKWKGNIEAQTNVVDEKNCELQMDSVFPVSQRRIPIKIINHTDNVIEMGRNDYKLEFYNESSQTWENALPKDHAYLMITDVVLPHDTLELTIYEYTGRTGKYRVTKNATVTYDLSIKSHNYILSGEFRLGKEDDSVINDMAIKKSVYDSFINTFGDNYRTEYDSLPDFLGGIYDADQYNFVIYVVGDLTDGKILLNKMLGRTDFNVKPSLFSYRHLRRMNDSILSFTMREKNKNICKETGFRFCSLSEKENRIFVYLDDCNNLSISKFKEYIANDSCIIFRQYENDLVIIAD